MKYPINVLKTAANLLNRVKTHHDDRGICGNFRDLVNNHSISEKYSWNHFDELLCKLFKLWPEFSGDESFPIHLSKKGKAGSEYFNNADRWAGKYGEARQRLINFCIDELEFMIEYALEQTATEDDE